MYLERSFEVDPKTFTLELPPVDEGFVEIWTRWAQQANDRSAWSVLSSNLPQLGFPIEQGVSRSAQYRAAVASGQPVETTVSLSVPSPESISLTVHRSPAGRIPIIVVRDRRTFETLVQALAHRNEPVDISPSQGAAMVAGYNNWQRIHEHRRKWEESATATTHSWAEEFKRFTQDKSNYQDRFLIVSEGPYSGIKAETLGLETENWLEISLAIRRDHECCHYFTRRLFGSMKNHLLDELLADWAGMTGAIGTYRADWFLKFLGISNDGKPETGGRLPIYLDPELDDAASVETLCRMTVACTRNLQALEETDPVGGGTGARAIRITALASFVYSELAQTDARRRILEREAQIRSRARTTGRRD